MRNKIIASVLFAAIVLNLTTTLLSEENSPQLENTEVTQPIHEEIRWLQAEAAVTITTKHEMPINRAPGIVTVIMAEEIKEMGLRTLTDVLRIVPGFDISMDANGQKRTAVRGVLDKESPKVRILIDGHSINEPGSGSASWNFDDLVVENARKIEVLRGPASALYGQNAFLAVINIITKDTDDIDGFQWIAGGGSFDTQNYNMLFGKEIGNLKMSGSFDYFDTQGHSEIVEQDILSPAPFSMAPGRSQNAREKTDLNLKLSYKNLDLKTKYMKKRREGYIGWDYALNDDTMWEDTFMFSELIYKLSIGEKLNIIPRLYYDQNNYDDFIELRPEGFVDTTETLDVVYPDGIKALVKLKLRDIGFENQFNYNVFEGNKITFGFQYEWSHLHDVDTFANINPVTMEPQSSFIDYSKEFPVAREATRQIWSLYLQDEWNVTEDIDFTVGVRFDHFKRFGGTTNPRIGLIWRFMDDAHLKFLFATAFRAPSLNEMFLTNNYIENGDSGLDPEKINTYEIGLGYDFTENLSGNINYFYNRLRDRIVLDTSRYFNNGGARVMGVEAGLRANFWDDDYFYANYTFQDAEDTRNRNRLPDVPIHKANFGLNLGLGKYINTNLHTFLSGPRPREYGDTRHNMPSYALTDFTLIGRNFLDNFEIRGSVNNLFDKKYYDPSPQNTVPTDYPQQGRSFMIELRYEF